MISAMLTEYQKSIDSYAESSTKFSDLSTEDIIRLVIEYLDEENSTFTVKIPAQDLATFFEAWLKRDEDEIIEFV